MFLSETRESDIVFKRAGGFGGKVSGHLPPSSSCMLNFRRGALPLCRGAFPPQLFPNLDKSPPGLTTPQKCTRRTSLVLHTKIVSTLDTLCFEKTGSLSESFGAR